MINVFLSTAEDCIEWIVKTRKVGDTTAQQTFEDYYHRMNSTDIADQICGSYRADRWMRQREWWWAFFIWGIGMAGVNAYKIYETIYEEEVAKKTPNLPPKWTHA